MDNVTVQGITVPKIGLGTWALRGSKCRQVIRLALELGYRHIDTAQMYGNEGAVGKALAETAVPREEIFVTTKIKGGNFRESSVIKSVRQSLEKLKTKYINLLLIHWPSRQVPISETIGAMNALQSDGSVRHIGVSNFSVEETEEARAASQTPVLTNQVEYHPFRSQRPILEYCIKNDLLLTAYSPVAKGRVVSNEMLRKIGSRYGKSAAQVALRWLTQQKHVIAIPKASSESHLRENLEILDFSLTVEEIKQIFSLHGETGDQIRPLLHM